jgi:antitoxin component YwqK of YwqJK toxin-antitoxin module
MSNIGVIKIYYDVSSNYVKEEYFQINGKKEGEYKYYYDNGQLKEISTYIDNKINIAIGKEKEMNYTEN